MKKVVGIVIAILVIVGLVFVGSNLVKKPSKPAKSLSMVVPEDVAFYYSVNNLNSIWSNIKGSNFWKKLTNLDLMKNIQLQQGLNDLKSQFKNNTGVDLNEDTFLKLFGQNIAVSIIPAGSADNPLQILIMATVDKTEVDSIQKSILESVRKKEADRISEEAYSDQEIINLEPATEDQVTVCWSLGENLLVVGIGPVKDYVKNVIDLNQNKTSNSLAQTEGFSEFQKKIPAGENIAVEFYLDFSDMQNYLQNLSLPGSPQGEQATAGPNYLKTIMGWSKIDDGLVSKMYIYPDMDNMPEAMKDIWEQSPGKLATMSFVPENTLLYIASNSINISTMWDTWMQNIQAQLSALQPQDAETGNPVQNWLDNVRDNWGIDIENDVMPILGNEAGLIFSDLAQGIVPTPKLAIALSVKDKVKAESIIEGLINKNNALAAEERKKLEEGSTEPSETTQGDTPQMPAAPRISLNLQQTPYENYTINTVSIPLVGFGLSPGYVFIDSLLVLATNINTLQEFIDVKKGKGNSLQASKQFGIIESIIPDNKNQMTYINLQRLLDIAINICEWIINFQQMSIPPEPTQSDTASVEMYEQRKAQAQTTITTLQNSVIPLLDTLQTLKFLVSTSANKGDHIEQTTVIRIQDL